MRNFNKGCFIHAKGKYNFTSHHFEYLNHESNIFQIAAQGPSATVNEKLQQKKF